MAPGAVLRCHMRIYQNLLLTAGLLCAASAGCTMSITPWTKGGGPAADGAQGNHTANKQAPPAPYPQGPYPAGNTPYGPNGPNAGPGNESMVQLIKQLNETDDQRKALLDQV